MKPPVKIFETKEEALFAEWEDEVDSQQGSSSEDVVVTVAGATNRGRSSVGVGSSGTQLAAEQTEIEDLGVM